MLSFGVTHIYPRIFEYGLSNFQTTFKDKTSVKKRISEAFPFWNTIFGENSAFLNIKSTYYTIEVKQMEQIAYLKGAKKGTLSFGYVSTEKVQTASKD